MNIPPHLTAAMDQFAAAADRDDPDAAILALCDAVAIELRLEATDRRQYDSASVSSRIISGAAAASIVTECHADHPDSLWCLLVSLEVADHGSMPTGVES